MRIQLTLYFVLFFLVYTLNGQQYKLNISMLKSEVLKEKKGVEIESIKKDSNGNLYIFKQNKIDKNFIIEKFTADFVRIKSYKIDTKFGNIIEGFFLKNNVIGFVEYRKTVKNSIVVNYEVNLYSSNLKTLNFEKRNLFNVDPEKYSFFKGNMNFLESKNHIIFNVKPDFDNKNHKIVVFDKDFNKLFENHIKLPYGDRKINLISVKASGIGDVFLLFKVTFKKTKKKEIDNYYHEIIKVNRDIKLTKKLTLENKLTSLKFEINEKDDIACIGFYSEKKENKLKGFCSFILDSETLNINHRSLSKFSNNFFNGTNGVDRNRKLEELKLSDISFSNNGEIRINAQEIYTTQASNFNNMPGVFIYTNSTIEHYNDIISIKTNKKGELIWSKNINRKNRLGPTGLYFVSYGLIDSNYKQFLAIHSYKNILDTSKQNSGFHENFLWPITKSNSNLYFVEYDNNGDSVCHTILKNKNQEVLYNVDNLQQISKNEIILYGFKKRKIQYLKITLTNENTKRF